MHSERKKGTKKNNIDCDQLGAGSNCLMLEECCCPLQCILNTVACESRITYVFIHFISLKRYRQVGNASGWLSVPMARSISAPPQTSRTRIFIHIIILCICGVCSPFFFYSHFFYFASKNDTNKRQRGMIETYCPDGNTALTTFDMFFELDNAWAHGAWHATTGAAHSIKIESHG